MSNISERIDADKSPDRVKRAKRESGSGCLIPPRIGISSFWAAQVRDPNGKLFRRTRLRSGGKVRGELKPGCDPKLPDSWSNITSARILLREVIEDVSKGVVAVGHDPSQLRYADLRQLYIQDYTEQEHRSLRTNTETGEPYVDSLTHLDKFFGYEKAGDEGMKVSNITGTMITKFKNERKDSGAANATVNRALAALRRMFALATDDSHGPAMLQHGPAIKMLPEGEARQGFLNVADYDKLYNALPAYVQPIFQTAFYTGMRKGELLNLTWDRVDLAEKMIRLEDSDVKNQTGREIPLIDGLPELLEGIRRKNPAAKYVFLTPNGEEIGSFIKAWRNACVKAAITVKINGQSVVSHFEEDGTYRGFLFHDLRRSALRNLVRAGVPRGVAMKITGHKTEEVFERYNIVDSADLQNAGQSVAEYLKQQRAEAERSDPVPRMQVVK
jgi:integrase